jgi:voltage-gated sodium channel
MIKKLFLNDRFILLLILMNVAVLFAGGFRLPTSSLSFLSAVDSLFTLLFVLELFIKMRTFGIKSYFKDNWNIFDFVLITMAIPSLLTYLIPHNIISLDFLLALRTLRVFKFFRFIRFVPNINKIITGAFKAAKASLLILLAFFIFNFTVSLISCFLYRNSAPEFFGDPLISFYSIFKVFTVEGWYEIPDAIAEGTESNIAVFFTRLYFIGILFIGGIFGLSLVNSIFVEAMIAENNDDLETDIKRLEQKMDEVLKKINK